MKKDGGGGVKQRGCGVKFTEGTLNSRTLISREWAGLSSEAECILFGSHSIFFFLKTLPTLKEKKSSHQNPDYQLLLKITGPSSHTSSLAAIGWRLAGVVFRILDLRKAQLSCLGCVSCLANM